MTRNRPRLSRLHVIAVVATLAWVLGAGLYSAWNNSMTSDEGVHAASGYLVLTRHEFRFDPEHPYLFKIISALPLLAVRLNPPSDDQRLWNAAWPSNYDSWKEARQWADEWFYNSGNNADLMIFLVRLPSVAVLFASCWFVYLLGKKWFSPTVGLLALVFTAFNPTVLAHGSLANDDLPVAFMFLLTVYFLWRYFERHSWKSLIQLAIVVGIAQLVKFSALALIPIAALWVLYVGITRQTLRQAIWHILAAGLIVWAIIWIGYGAPFDILNGYIYTFRGPFTFPAGFTPPVIEIIRVLIHLFPVDYAKGIALVSYSVGIGRTTYLLGHHYQGGLWYYFPVVYLYKTQLVGVFLLAVGGWIGWQHAWQKKFEPIHLLLGGTIVVFGITALANKLDIGIRHILPLLLLFSFYLALTLVRIQALFPRLPKWLPGVLVALYIIPAVAYLDNFLGYVNILAGSPSNAYQIFDDSNLDWGQQAKQIAQVDHDFFSSEPIYTNYAWGSYALPYYGVTTYPFDSRTPAGGLVMLTASNLSAASRYDLSLLTPITSIGNHTFFFRMK